MCTCFPEAVARPKKKQNRQVWTIQMKARECSVKERDREIRTSARTRKKKGDRERERERGRERERKSECRQGPAN